MEVNEELDEIDYEVNVFVSKALAEYLHMFHYPTRDESSAERNECLSAKVKPKQKKVELEFGLEIHSQNYDMSRGEQMAINVDGMKPSGDTYFKSSHMDKSVLSGTKSSSSIDRYVVGCLRKGEFHMTPLNGILELTPSFKYMDKVDSLAKKALATDNDDDEEAVAVTVRFEGPNAAKDKQIREKSYQYLQQKSANEPWINVNYNPCGSHKSTLECDNLICSQMYKDATSSGVCPKDYVKNLVPECLRLTGYKSLKDEETAILVDHPLSDQIKHLLSSGYVLRFSTFLEKLPPDVDASVERLVQQFAVLVQGCWVVKSELLYAEDSVSPLTGFSGKNMINARDYVVWLFTKSRHVTRREVLSSIYVPDQDLKSILIQIAVRSDRGWEFKHPYDSEFVESHRSIEQSQDIKWNLRYKKMVKELNLGMCDPDGQLPKPSCPVLPRPRQKRHSRSSLSEEGEESGTDSGTSGLKDSKAKRMYNPKKCVPSTSSSKLTTKPKPYHIATLDVSPTFLETSPSDELRGELKEYVEEVIRNQFIMTLSELKEAVSEGHLSALCNRSDFESLLEEALSSCGTQKLKNKWPQNTTPEPLYAFTAFGNKLDRYRSILLDLFSTTARARTNLFVKTVEDELREIISDGDCRQIFEDYCVHKSGFYYLKGTISLDS